MELDARSSVAQVVSCVYFFCFLIFEKFLSLILLSFVVADGQTGSEEPGTKKKKGRRSVLL